MRWVTRVRPKIDRIACPWLILRFIDNKAEFLFVPPGDVMKTAEKTGATSYDVPDVELTHDGPLCGFDAMMKKYKLIDSALNDLATIVRGADTSRPDLEPQCLGLLSISLGLSHIFKDDHEQLRYGLVIYDALFAWCKHVRGEAHNWNPQRKASLSTVCHDGAWDMPDPTCRWISSCEMVTIVLSRIRLTQQIVPILFLTMVFRATTILCCFLTTSVPALTLAQVIEHAQEHLEALLTGHGHTHDDGQTPHHDHEEDGTPIPADKSTDMVRVASQTLAKIMVQSAEPAPFTERLVDIASLTRLLQSLFDIKDDIPRLSNPSPGDTLPLLI